MPLRLALDDEGLAGDGELILGLWIGDLACSQLEGRGLGVDAGLPKPTMVSGRLPITRTDTGSRPAGV